MTVIDHLKDPPSSTPCFHRGCKGVHRKRTQWQTDKHLLLSSLQAATFRLRTSTPSYILLNLVNFNSFLLTDFCSPFWLLQPLATATSFANEFHRSSTSCRKSQVLLKIYFGFFWVVLLLFVGLNLLGSFHGC